MPLREISQTAKGTLTTSSSCHKVTYKSLTQARRALAQWKSSGKLRRKESMHAYECPACGWFHYGHDNRPSREV